MDEHTTNRIFPTPSRNGKPKRKRSTAKGLVPKLAAAITEGEHFARDAGGLLYKFNEDEGVYKPDAEWFIKRMVKAECQNRRLDHLWSTKVASEVVAFVAADAFPLLERPPLDVLNLANGLLRLADRKLLPHSPNHMSSLQLPIEYDPSAKCPNIDKFIGEVFPPDATALAYEIPGWLMTPDTSIQKAVLLTGGGLNGKSTYLNVVQAFLGEHNTVSVPLHRLESDKFTAARLVGKLANICPDLPSDRLAGTSVFKAITGNDRLLGERKYSDSFEFTPFARLVFSANHPPRSSDSSFAFFRRWLTVPFDRTIEPEDQIPAEELMARLTTREEMSGLLNRALDARDEMRKRGNKFSEPESVRRAGDEFRAVTDPFAMWLSANTVEDAGAFTPVQDLLTAYMRAVEHEGLPTKTLTDFGLSLKRERPNVEVKQRTVGGKLVRVYVGIGLVPKG